MLRFPIMLRPKDVSRFLLDHFRKNPEEALRTAFDAMALKLDVPLALLRYVVEHADLGSKGPKDIEFEAVPPALRVSATISVMGTALRVGASIRVEALEFDDSRLFCSLRLADVTLAIVGDSDSPVAALIKSGALDLSKPGKLVQFMPKKPALIVAAEDDRIDLDFMRLPKVAKNEKLIRALRVASPVVGVRAIMTGSSHVCVALRANPLGVTRSVSELRKLRDVPAGA